MYKLYNELSNLTIIKSVSVKTQYMLPELHFVEKQQTYNLYSPKSLKRGWAGGKSARFVCFEKAGVY